MTTAHEAAAALVRALGLRFGSVVVEVSDEKITLVRLVVVLKAKDLEGLAVTPA